MKYSLSALAVAALLTSPSVFAAKVYDADGTELKVGGRVEFRGDFIGTGGPKSGKGEEVKGTMKDKTRARLNLKGKTEITDGLSGFAVYEAEQGTGDTDFENRYMYAGLAMDGSSFSVGRQDTAAVLVSDITDVTEFSGIQQYLDSASDKQDSTFAYRGKFDALHLQATYTAQSEEDKDGFGLSALYSLPFGLDLGIAYSGADLGKGAGQEDQILVGAGFTMESLYAGVTYSTGDVSDATNTEFDALELALAYRFTEQFTLKTLYGSAEQKAASVKTDTYDFFEVVGYYKFNKHLSTYLSYMSNGLDEKDNDSDGKVDQGEDTLRLGLKYGF